jgi:hypothetical protein
MTSSTTTLAGQRAAANLKSYVRRLEALADTDNAFAALGALRALIELGLRHDAAQPREVKGPITPWLTDRELRVVAGIMARARRRREEAAPEEATPATRAETDAIAAMARRPEVTEAEVVDSQPAQVEHVAAPQAPQDAAKAAAPPPTWTEEALAEVGVYRAKSGAWTHSLGDDHAQRIVSGAISREAALRAERQWKEEVHAMKRAKPARRTGWI